MFQGPSGQVELHVFSNPVCASIAGSILAGHTYPCVPGVGNVRTIMDIGANIGASTLYFAAMYPEATVYAFEPGSQAFALLERNVASSPRIHACPFGLHSHPRITALYDGLNDTVECSVFHTPRTKTACESVYLRSAQNFLVEHGVAVIDIVKIDTEGCEVPILRSLEPYLPRIQVLYVEYHNDRDRGLIDAMMAASHVLWRAQVWAIHRGEFCYLRKDLAPADCETPELGE